LNNFLGNDKLIIRFISLYVIGLILFFISWTIAYFLFPEGLLKGIGLLDSFAGDTAAESLHKEFMKIFFLNAFGFTLIILGNYILRVRYFSFGYLVPLAWMIMYAVILGTNSFSIPMETTMAPSFAVFTRSGLYEMMAGFLLAVATDTIAINQSESFFSASKPIPKDDRVPMKRNQWIAIGVAFLILAMAAFREAYMIINY